MTKPTGIITDEKLRDGVAAILQKKNGSILITSVCRVEKTKDKGTYLVQTSRGVEIGEYDAEGLKNFFKQVIPFTYDRTTHLVNYYARSVEDTEEAFVSIAEDMTTVNHRTVWILLHPRGAVLSDGKSLRVVHDRFVPPPSKPCEVLEEKFPHINIAQVLEDLTTLMHEDARMEEYLSTEYGLTHTVRY